MRLRLDLPVFYERSANNPVTPAMLHRDSPQRAAALGAEDLVFLTQAKVVGQHPASRELLPLVNVNLLSFEFGRLLWSHG